MNFPSVFNVKNLNGTNGFSLTRSYDTYAADLIPVSGLGDINGDGLSDVIIGSLYANDRAGGSYVVFGSKDGFQASVNLSALNGKNGFAINGTASSPDHAVLSVSGAGDVNGDGVNDIIIGSQDRYQGASYILFGSKNGFQPNINLFDLNGKNGFAIKGKDDGNSIGFSVSGLGDINGDGLSDVIVGSIYGNYYAGASYVVLGSDKGFTPIFNLSVLNGKNGFTINSKFDPNSAGYTVGGAGDINGDGINDLIIGMPIGNQDAGTSYIIYGNKHGFQPNINLADLNGKNGFVVHGNPGDLSGVSASSAGDINGDHLNDLIIGAPGARNFAGAGYVLFGNKDGFKPSINLSDLNGYNGFKLNGVAPNDNSGLSVSRAGDINNDGIDDLLIGAFKEIGVSYIVFGSRDKFQPEINLSDLNGLNGFTINNMNATDYLGSSVSGAGDMNGDGLDDFIISATNSIEIGYVVFGSDL